MSEKIASALDYHFDKHRVVFWYDDGGKLKDVYEAYTVPEDGEKAEIDNNEFKLKHRMLKEKPEKKFLVYSYSSKPQDEGNWLLDLNLANFVFASNEAAMVQQELEVPDSLLPLIREHLPYFKNVHDRLTPLRSTLRPNMETEETLLLAMMAVLCGNTRESRERKKDFTEIILYVFLDTLIGKNPSVWAEIEKYALHEVFWKNVKTEFGYSADTPTIEGFACYLFQTVFDFQLGRIQSGQARYMFTTVDTWRKHQDYKQDVQELLDKMEKELNIAHEVETIGNIDDLVRLDIFKEVDRQIFSRLLEGILHDKIESSRALEVIERRRETYWYKSGNSDRLIFHYRTLYYYLRFTEKLLSTSLTFSSVDEGWRRYREEYYELDGDYRRFLFTCYESESTTLFSGLLDKINDRYTEAYLQPLADAWQQALDGETEKMILDTHRMSLFFRKHMEQYLRKDRSVFLIVSDGFRYELGIELTGRLRRMNRFTVETAALAAPVPTYTQLGMACLLPHETITIGEDGNSVLADGMSTAGLENRQKVLQKWLDDNYDGKKARAVRADTFMDMPRTEQNDFIRGIDIVVLYSSGVDAIGDDPKTELRLPRAADDEIRNLETICSHIGNNLSRTHIIITADHGFLYRYREVPETEMSRIERSDGEIRRDHRFIFAEQPLAHPSADILGENEVEWTAPFQLQCARGLTRIRRPGGGTRYVHGGRMPQELCVPLLLIRKTRIDDVERVDVAVLDRQNQITTGQVNVSFFQENPVEEKRPARELDAVFEGDDGTEISNTARLIFDSEEKNEQNRSRNVSFVFTKAADGCNGKYISLKLYDIKTGGVRTFYREYSYYFQKRLQMDVDF
jgi:uncharacterized protein (TIGR02687 family)